jgi:hypothetical protein
VYKKWEFLYTERAAVKENLNIPNGAPDSQPPSRRFQACRPVGLGLHGFGNHVGVENNHSSPIDPVDVLFRVYSNASTPALVRPTS